MLSFLKNISTKGTMRLFSDLYAKAKITEKEFADFQKECRRLRGLNQLDEAAFLALYDEFKARLVCQK